MINSGFVNANRPTNDDDDAVRGVRRAIREICGQRAIFARTTNDDRETNKRKEAEEGGSRARIKVQGLGKYGFRPSLGDIFIPHKG